jgi:exopolyphosphatase/pppGpp-phosphohydrolase
VVISREEEVELGWLAAAKDRAPETDLGVIDIGGGSTGLSAGKAGLRAPAEMLGLGVGGHNVAAMHGLAHPVSRNALASALAAIAAQVGAQAAAMKSRPAVGVVIGGTATVLAAARRESPRDGDDPMGTDDFTRADWLERWLYSVAPLDGAGRAAAGVPADRVDIVVAGGAILLAVLRAWGLDGFYSSPRTILDGFIERSLQADGTH